MHRHANLQISLDLIGATRICIKQGDPLVVQCMLVIHEIDAGDVEVEDADLLFPEVTLLEHLDSEYLTLNAIT